MVFDSKLIKQKGHTFTRVGIDEDCKEKKRWLTELQNQIKNRHKFSIPCTLLITSIQMLLRGTPKRFLWTQWGISFAYTIRQASAHYFVCYLSFNQFSENLRQIPSASGAWVAALSLSCAFPRLACYLKWRAHKLWMVQPAIVVNRKIKNWLSDPAPRTE